MNPLPTTNRRITAALKRLRSGVGEMEPIRLARTQCIESFAQLMILVEVGFSPNFLDSRYWSGLQNQPPEIV
jgi:hypothetical protein